MACASEQDIFQQWLAQINQVCGRFAARPLEGAFLGELETSYTQSLKLSTVTAAGVNLFRTPSGDQKRQRRLVLHRVSAGRQRRNRTGRPARDAESRGYHAD